MPRRRRWIGRRRSLRRQIVLWYSLVLLAALVLFTGAAALLLRQALARAERASLRQAARATEELTVPASIPRVRTREEFVTLVDEDGEEYEALVRQTQLVTGGVIGVVIRSADLSSRALGSFLLISLLLIPLTAAAAALGGRALLERVLDPLSRLVTATREIGIGGLGRRVEVPQDPAELHDLAHSFNGMLTRLQRAVDALRNFTADASHELRTPLTSIRGTVQVALSRPRTREELEETLGEVMEETQWMLHLVDGLLTLARGEEETGPREVQPVELAPLLADVVEVGAALAMGEGKEIAVQLDAPEDLAVVGSAGQLRQVFLNLVANAVKFTERGEVRVTAEAAGEWVQVRVRDTGVGIAPEELPRVFDRFYRGDAARGRPGGTGLGLAIVRLLVEQHGGSVRAISELGAGSEFTVRLPRRLPEPAAEPPQ